MNGTLMSLKTEVHNVEREDRQIKREEEKLSRKISSLESGKGANHWGEEGTGITNSIHMDPLPFHRRHLFGMGNHEHHGGLHGFFSGMKDFFKGLSHHTGPANEHSHKPIIPTHNITKPGAHPAYAAKKNEDHKDDKKDEHKDEHKD